VSTESNSVGKTSEVVPDKVDETAVDSGVSGEAEGTPTVDAPIDDAPAADASAAEASADDAPADVAPADVPQETPAETKPAETKPAAKRKTSGVKSKLEEDPNMDVEPLELIEEEPAGQAAEKHWYILKVQVNREGTIRDALERRVKIEGLESFVEEIVVPTEDIAEFTKSGKRKITKRKLYPGYIMVNMVINDDTWFAVRETPGIGDFTGSAGKPTPMDPREVERILRRDVDEDEETQIKTSIPFSIGDHVRVKEGNFQNFEGDVDKIDEAHGLITVMINIFNRATPVEIQYWQIEKV
jgi:transcriptional antiterminator NusG